MDELYDIPPLEPTQQRVQDPLAETIEPLLSGDESLSDIKKAYEKMVYLHEKELHQIRKNHLNKLFNFTKIWSLAVIYILISSGLNRLWWFPTYWDFYVLPFNLDSSVLIAFITSTTATIIGLYTIAAYWLFKKKRLAFDNRSPSD